MTSKTRKSDPDLQITVAGITYTLRYSVKALIALEDHWDLQSIDEVTDRLMRGVNLSGRDIVAILWAGLRSRHPDLGIGDAETILDEAGIEEIQAIIGGAIGASAPEVGEPEDVARPTKPGRSTKSSDKVARSA